MSMRALSLDSRSLHDALPIYIVGPVSKLLAVPLEECGARVISMASGGLAAGGTVTGSDGKAGSGVYRIDWNGETLPGKDRKSTRLNSSHLVISYAVFCFKKQK